MSKIQINFDDLEDFAVQLGKAANKCDEALGHINVDLYSLLANIPGVASKNIHELETIFENNLKKYKKNLIKAQHLMRITEAIMSENERKLARKAREIVQENSWDFSPLQMGDKNALVPEIYGRVEQDSLTKLTDEKVEGLRNYIRKIKNGEIDSNLDDYGAMPEDNKWQGNIFPYNPGGKQELDPVTKALGKFAFDFLLGDVVTILDPEALTEDKLIAAAMMLPPAKVVKIVDKLKYLEKMKDTIDHLDDASVKVKDAYKRNKIWDMPVGGGYINGRMYSQHAMERMAPDTPEVRAKLSSRAIKKAKELGYSPGTKKYSDFVNKYVQPRNIPPSVIEDAIKNHPPIPGNKPDTLMHITDSVQVIVNGNGDVITVIPK